jgi:hypothetical protein
MCGGYPPTMAVGGLKLNTGGGYIPPEAASQEGTTNGIGANVGVAVPGSNTGGVALRSVLQCFAWCPRWKQR